MSRIYSVYEQNFAHFKFLSQHFHKSVAVATGSPELKGIKAHDRFARLFGWQSLNDVNQFLKGHEKRLYDFGKLENDRILSVYADLYPNISVKSLLPIYYDFFEFTHSKESSNHISLETLRQLKSFSFFPKDPDKDLGQVADYLAVALESFSLLLKSEQGGIDRNLLNSTLMLYFDFYHKGLISDFNWQDIADLTHPQCYHDAFVKYKTQLKPTFGFISSASHCYDKITYYTDNEHQLEAHRNLCRFMAEIQKENITPQENREHILFNKVYQKAIDNGVSTVSAPNSFEVNKDKVFTLDDFDLSRARFVSSNEPNRNGSKE